MKKQNLLMASYHNHAPQKDTSVVHCQRHRLFPVLNKEVHSLPREHDHHQYEQKNMGGEDDETLTSGNNRSLFTRSTK